MRAAENIGQAFGRVIGAVVGDDEIDFAVSGQSVQRQLQNVRAELIFVGKGEVVALGQCAFADQVAFACELERERAGEGGGFGSDGQFSVDRAQGGDAVAVVGHTGVVADIEANARVCLQTCTTRNGCDLRRLRCGGV